MTRTQGITFHQSAVHQLLFVCTLLSGDRTLLSIIGKAQSYQTPKQENVKMRKRGGERGKGLSQLLGSVSSDRRLWLYSQFFR